MNRGVGRVSAWLPPMLERKALARESNSLVRWCAARGQCGDALECPGHRQSKAERSAAIGTLRALAPLRARSSRCG
jgi:hypothetical protein